MTVAAVVAEQLRGTAIGRDHQIEVAVVVDVGVRGAARDDLPPERGPGLRRQLLEAMPAEIPEQVRRLRVGDLRLDRADVVGDVAVGGEDIGQPVEVDVEEETGEREREERCLPHRRRRRFVDEQPVPLVMVQRHHLVREVADDEAGPAAAVVVGGVDAHARARDAGFVERDAGRHADVREGAVSLVAIQLVRLRVVGDEQIEPAVGVVIDQGDAERFGRRVIETGAMRDVLERPVPLVPEQRRALAFVGFRRAIGLRLAVERAEQILLDRPVHVVRDEEVEQTVAVVVEPRRARRESGIGDPRARGDVGEPAAAEISEQVIRAERGHVNVDVAVVVVVARGGAEPVHLHREPRRARDVGERAVAVVVVQREIRLRPRPARPVRRVDQQEVLPAVVVVVEKRAAGSQRLGQVLLPERAVVVGEADAGGRGDVGERQRRRDRACPTRRPAREQHERRGDRDQPSCHRWNPGVEERRSFACPCLSV